MSSSAFSRAIVPYDGSEPSKAALTAALALGLIPPSSVIVNVVDETAFIAQTATVAVVYDPAPLVAALEAQGEAVLSEATALCAAAGVAVKHQLIHDAPVRGILDAAARHHGDLIVMGTHARSGVGRAFLGSTTEGVLRLTRVPLLSFRAGMPAQTTIGPILVAVDEGEPADRAVALAAAIAPALHASIDLVTAVDVEGLLESVAPYGFDPAPVIAEARENALGVLERAARSINGVPVTSHVLEGRPTRAILAHAQTIGARLIVIGSHGRRGLQRLFLGSVAEHVLRGADVGVLVAR